jgi:hypothetical protein
MTYNLICDALEYNGWTKETIFVSEKTRYMTRLYSSEPGETTLVIEIYCPQNQKMLIRGTTNGDVENFKDAYSIQLGLMDSLKNEISQFTKIRITKERTIECISSPVRCFYGDISKGDDDHLYRPKENILLQEREHLFVYVMGENTSQKLPDRSVDKDHTFFNIEADIFTL